RQRAAGLREATAFQPKNARPTPPDALYCAVIRTPCEIERGVYECTDRRLIIAPRRHGWLDPTGKRSTDHAFSGDVALSSGQRAALFRPRIRYILFKMGGLALAGDTSHGGDHAHEEHRFTVSVGEPLTFDEARAFCGPDKYLLNLQAAVNVSHVPATLQRHAEIYPTSGLTCRAKLRNGTVLKEARPGNYAYAHVWTKNGIFLDHTYRFLQPETVSEPNAYTHIIPSSQGRYRCGLKALPSGNTVWSNVITVVLEDFDTYRLTGHLHANVDHGPIQFAGSSFFSFARSIEKALNRQQQQELASWSYSGITIDGMNRINISIFIYYQRAELAWLADGQTRKHSVFNDSTALQDLLANNSITDVLHCRLLKQGTFSFDSKGHVGFLESIPPCLTDSNELVSRSCNINFEAEPTWGAFNESTCKAGTQSQAFDVQTNTHYLLCSPHYCVPKIVNGTWSEVRLSCNNMGGYLTSNGPGSPSCWHQLSCPWARQKILLHSQPSTVPRINQQKINRPQNHPINPRINQPRNPVSVTDVSCNDTRQGKCAFRHRSFFRDLNPCPRGGWLDLSSKSTCLWLKLSPLNYKRASQECRANEGRLAVINNSSLSYTLALLLAPSNVPRQFDRFWIGLQRSSGGVYQWETGEPLRDFAWHPRTDYRHSAGTLFVDRYSVQGGLAMRYSLEDPSRKLPYICQAPLRTGTPWLRVERRDRGQRVVLTCRVSAEIIPGSVLWYKDGIAVQGDRARAADGHDTTLVIERAAPENPYLQGYYWCEGISVADFRAVESKKTLVRFPGVKTYACTMPLHGRNPQLYEFSSNKTLQFASDFRRKFLYVINDTTFEGYHMYELRVVDVLQDTSATDVVRFLAFFTRLQRLPRTTSQDEEMLIIEYLRSAVMNSTSSLVTSPPVLPNALRIRSTEMCFQDTTMLDTGLEKKLTWPATPIGSVAIPRETCIHGELEL
ncbi:hypothetical protein MTO96_049412, partial [Rhipicephalus appendiculatus]